MKLSTALKLKTRTVAELNRYKEILERENVRKEGDTSTIDCAKIHQQVKTLVVKLTLVKTAIAKANVGIYEKIESMAELKSMITYYQSFNTQDGTVTEGFGQNVKEVTYKAFLKRENIDAIKLELQEKINAFQDEIDIYNATTEVILD